MPRLTPDEIATRGFAAAFRGVSELEVRNFLKRVADEMATALARESALESQIDELQEQVKHPPVVTEDRLLDALGEETARVLRSAQESAEEIRTRAAATAEEVTTAAEAAATATRAEADADAAAMRDAAQTAAAKEAGRELVNEARAVRERILADLGRRRMLLQAQIDELRAGRDRLLDSYRVVKRTLNGATEALVQVEARAAQELAGPPPALEVPPVDGELAALAGELTGEAGPISADVESLFARLREQSAGPTLTDELPAPGGVLERESEPETVIDLAEDPEPERSGDEQLGSVPTDDAPDV